MQTLVTRNNTTLRQQGCLFATVSFWGSRLPHRSQQWSHSAGGGTPLPGCSFRSESKSLQTPGWRQTSPRRRHRIENTAPGQRHRRKQRQSSEAKFCAPYVCAPAAMHRGPERTESGTLTPPHLSIVTRRAGTIESSWSISLTWANWSLKIDIKWVWWYNMPCKWAWMTNAY